MHPAKVRRDHLHQLIPVPENNLAVLARLAVLPVQSSARRLASLISGISITDLPNIDPASAADLRRLGIHHPKDRIGKNAAILYHILCAPDGIRHKPCVPDILQSVVDYMHGGEALAWWTYSAKRKQQAPT